VSSYRARATSTLYKIMDKSRLGALPAEMKIWRLFSLPPPPPTIRESLPKKFTPSTLPTLRDVPCSPFSKKRYPTAHNNSGKLKRDLDPEEPGLEVFGYLLGDRAGAVLGWGEAQARDGWGGRHRGEEGDTGPPAEIPHGNYPAYK